MLKKLKEQLTNALIERQRLYEENQELKAELKERKERANNQ